MSFTRKLTLLTAVALLVRVLFLLLEPSTGPVADERTWTNWAVEALVTPRVAFSPFRTRMIFYPPLYPYFIAVCYALFGTLMAVKWAQLVVGALLVPALGRVAARSFGEATGLASAALAAFYPELVWFSVHFWSETLFMALLWWSFERLLAADASARVRVAAAAGALWGLAILTRETVLYFTPLAALWLAVRRGRAGLAKAVLFLLVAVSVVIPWTYRNWVLFGAFIPVSTAGGLNLYQGNALLTRQQVYDRYEAVQGRAEQYRWAREQGLKAIRDRQPLWFFEKLREEMPNFWEADSQALVHIKRGAYGWPVRPALASAAALLVIVPYVVVLGLFVAGVAALRGDRPGLLLICFLIYYNLIHVVSHGYARYRLPALPVVLLLAAYAWRAWRAGEYPPLDARRRILAAVLAVGLGLALIPSLSLNLEDPAFGLRIGTTAPAEDAESP